MSADLSSEASAKGDPCTSSQAEYAAPMRRGVTTFCVIALTVSGCATTQPRSIPRVVDGQVQSGAFVPPYAYEWFTRGEIAMAKGKYDEAAIAFETARAAPSEDPYLLTQLAKALELSNRSSSASRVLKIAQRATPDDESVWLATGDILVTRNETNAALMAYAKAVEVAPRSGKGVLASAALLQKLGQMGRAQALLGSFLDVPDLSLRTVRQAYLNLALSQGDTVAVPKEVLGSANQRKAWDSTIRNAARKALNKNRPSMAIALLDSLDKNDVSNTRIEAWIAMGQFDRVEAALGNRSGRSEESDTRDAKWLLSIGRLKRAARLLKGYQSAHARYLRGQVYARQGYYKKAAAEFAAVPHGANDYCEARTGLIDALQTEGRNALASEISTASVGDEPCNPAP